MRASPLWGLPRMLTARIRLVGIGSKLHFSMVENCFILSLSLAIKTQLLLWHLASNMNNDSINWSLRFRHILIIFHKFCQSTSSQSFHIPTKSSFWKSDWSISLDEVWTCSFCSRFILSSSVRELIICTKESINFVFIFHWPYQSLPNSDTDIIVIT